MIDPLRSERLAAGDGDRATERSPTARSQAQERGAAVRGRSVQDFGASPSATSPSPVARYLQHYGGLVRTRLAHYLEGDGWSRPIDRLVADYPLRGGKMLRPGLCMASALAFGGRREEAIDTAVALELLHNALLVHDDIEDGSAVRRGGPTLHRMHGVPIAINVGDALALRSFRPLIDNFRRLAPNVALAVLEETERMADESAEGQAIELDWRDHNVLGVSESDYLRMVLKKTCWLGTIYPCRVGALIATGGALDLDRFVRFGFFLGAAFQVQDDLLNLIGDSAQYGKELNGDLLEGKRTLMLIHLMRNASDRERERLECFLGRERGEKEAPEAAWVRGLMDRYGSIEYGRQLAHGLAGAALHEYTAVFGQLPESPHKRFLRSLVTWVIERR